MTEVVVGKTLRNPGENFSISRRADEIIEVTRKQLKELRELKLRVRKLELLTLENNSTTLNCKILNGSSGVGWIEIIATMLGSIVSLYCAALLVKMTFIYQERKEDTLRILKQITFEKIYHKLKMTKHNEQKLLEATGTTLTDNYSTTMLPEQHKKRY